MANDYFRFKQFLIRQGRCAMKVGTDGVLLGAWASVEHAQTILDVGTGTGLIALMLAQRCGAAVDALDVDPDACLEAAENVAASPFADRVRVFHTAFDDFRPAKLYDLIVSNPPYFRQSLKSPDGKRNMARHAGSLSFASIIEKGREMLAPGGRIALILPFEQAEYLAGSLPAAPMWMARRTDVLPTPHSAPKRMLAELSASPADCVHSTLTIEERPHVYTEEFSELIRAFYL